MRGMLACLLVLLLVAPAWGDDGINGLTTENIEAQLRLQNVINRGDWEPVLKESGNENACLAMYYLNKTTNVLAFCNKDKKITGFMFFVDFNREEKNTEKMSIQYLKDGVKAAFAAAGMCGIALEDDGARAKNFLAAVSPMNKSLYEGGTTNWIHDGIDFGARIVGGVYTLAAKKK